MIYNKIIPKSQIFLGFDWFHSPKHQFEKKPFLRHFTAALGFLYFFLGIKRNVILESIFFFRNLCSFFSFDDFFCWQGIFLHRFSLFQIVLLEAFDAFLEFLMLGFKTDSCNYKSKLIFCSKKIRKNNQIEKILGKKSRK